MTLHVLRLNNEIKNVGLYLLSSSYANLTVGNIASLLKREEKEIYRTIGSPEELIKKIIHGISQTAHQDVFSLFIQHTDIEISSLEILDAFEEKAYQFYYHQNIGKALVNLVYSVGHYQAYSPLLKRVVDDWGIAVLHAKGLGEVSRRLRFLAVNALIDRLLNRLKKVPFSSCNQTRINPQEGKILC